MDAGEPGFLVPLDHVAYGSREILGRRLGSLAGTPATGTGARSGL